MGKGESRYPKANPERTTNEQRFGLSKVKETDNREIFAPFLSNMHTHNMDFHSTFRNLAHFSPSRGISNGAYIAEYTTELIRNCMVARRAEEREPAQKAFEAWFKVYAARAVEEWEEGEVGEWELKRKIAMQGVNPRFVLRQWVLEEVIQEMEAGLAEGDEAGRMEARAKLNRILQVSLYDSEEPRQGLISRCRLTLSCHTVKTPVPIMPPTATLPENNDSAVWAQRKC